MIDLRDVEVVRPWLVKFCLLPSGRTSPPLANLAAHRWRPATVMHSASRSMYSDAGAWEFIADCLRANCNIKCQPPSGRFNDHAYVMVESDGGDRRIYMKVAIQPGCDQLIGVSFHYERP